jgi:hypothetical protein
MFAGSNPAENDAFLRAMRISGEEVKPAVPCHKILRHMKALYSIKAILVYKIQGYFSPSFF